MYKWQVKTLIATTILIISTNGFADTTKAGCKLAWDWEGDQNRIDGFKFYVDDATQGIVVTKDKREIACADAQLTPGQHIARVTAYNALGESLPSNPLTFSIVVNVPGEPTNLRLIIGQ